MAERPRIRRLGLTMRVVEADGYVEPRDALAQDWGRFLGAADPSLCWCPVPNVGARAVALARELGLEALVLTGGNDPGGEPTRDATEAALLDDALARRIPVLAVCRGLQFIQTHFGGPLRECDPRAHVAARHPVASRGAGGIPAGRFEVNSFHRLGIQGELAVPELVPFATTDDGWVEGATLRGHDVVGLMWHPERAGPSAALDLQFFRYWLGIPAGGAE